MVFSHIFLLYVGRRSQRYQVLLAGLIKFTYFVKLHASSIPRTRETINRSILFKVWRVNWWMIVVRVCLDGEMVPPVCTIISQPVSQPTNRWSSDSQIGISRALIMSVNTVCCPIVPRRQNIRERVSAFMTKVKSRTQNAEM